MDVQQDTETAMGKVIMAQMQQQTLQSIRQAVRAELLEDVRDEAVELAKAELEDEFSRRRERLQDDLAKFKASLEDELESELDRREAQLQQEVRDQYDERLLTLKDDLHAAAVARDQATTVLVSLVTQLLAESPKRYLASMHITELDLVGLNQVLARHGLRVLAEFRHSARQVVCTLKSGAGQRTAFWIEKALGPGVADDQGDQDDGPGT